MLTPFEPFGGIAPEPFAGLMSLREAMNRLLEESFIGPTALEPFRRLMPVDLRETETQYVIEASLPGVKVKEIRVTATTDTVTIRAARTGETGPDKEKEKGKEKEAAQGKENRQHGQQERYVRRERYQGEISRTIGLPGPINPDQVTATYEHGVLTLTLPKSAKSVLAEIPIEIRGAKEAQKAVPTS